MNALDYFKVTDQVAVVTGAGKGLGRAVALALAEAGADVAVVARTESSVKAVVAEIEARGRRGLALAADLRDPASPAPLVAEVMKVFGKIDIWVNNAGGADDVKPYPLAETTEEHWRELMSLNLDAVWRCTKEASKVMTEGGSIVNMSSIASMRAGIGGYGPYGTSKAAVNHLTTLFAKELAPRRIRVNAVAPGPVPTESYLRSTQGAPDPDVIAMDRGVPLGRVGKPEEVGLACLYFASPASAWCTGQTLALAGGL